MRNLKRLSAVLIAITVLVAAFVPAFAADSFSYEAEAKMLFDAGLIAGTDSGEYVPDLGAKLDRQSGFVLMLKLLGKEEEAKKLTDSEANQILKKYSDASTIASWAKKQVAYMTKNNLAGGYPKDKNGDIKIGATDPYLGKAFASLILNNLGYAGQYDYNTTAMSKLVEIGGLTDEEADLFGEKELIRDDAMGMSYAALFAGFADNQDTVLARLAQNAAFEAKALACGLLTVAFVDVSPASITTEFGKSPAMPEKVEVTYNSGATKPVDVSWDLTELDVNKAGSYEVMGTVAYYEEGVSIVVEVEENAVPTITSVTTPEAIEIVLGQELELPEELDAVYSDETTDKVAVEWNLDDFDANVEGTYELIGTIEGFEAGVKISVTVKAPIVDDVSAYVRASSFSASVTAVITQYNVADYPTAVNYQIYEGTTAISAIEKIGAAVTVIPAKEAGDTVVVKLLDSSNEEVASIEVELKADVEDVVTGTVANAQFGANVFVNVTVNGAADAQVAKFQVFEGTTAISAPAAIGSGATVLPAKVAGNEVTIKLLAEDESVLYTKDVTLAGDAADVVSATIADAAFGSKVYAKVTVNGAPDYTAASFAVYDGTTAISATASIAEAATILPGTEADDTVTIKIYDANGTEVASTEVELAVDVADEYVATVKGSFFGAAVCVTEVVNGGADVNAAKFQIFDGTTAISAVVDLGTFATVLPAKAEGATVTVKLIDADGVTVVATIETKLVSK